MKIDDLAEAIEHLETARKILRQKKFPVFNRSRAEDIYSDAVKDISFHIKLLRNELHYAEKEKLANWLMLSNKACTGLAGTAAADGEGSQPANQ